MKHLSAADETTGSAVESSAALALGRLDGALEHAPAPALRLFAARLIRDTLIAGLRQEGHAFTEQRFHAWFAGLVTLSDAPARHARPPRVVCEAILTELTHQAWSPLADMAIRLIPALLAPQDLEVQDAHAQVHAVMHDARLLVGKLRQAPPEPPFASLWRLHHDVLNSVRFAPPERLLPGPGHSWRRPLDQYAASPLWAIELHYGEYLSAAEWLRPALPLPGLIRLDALREHDPALARIKRAEALRRIALALHQRLGEAIRLTPLERPRMAGRRSTSRAPALFEILAGFGPLRSAQMESLLGASRLGVRSMIAALESEDRIECTTIAGSHLYSASMDRGSGSGRFDEATERAFSSEALNDFDASIARLDDLLARGAEPSRSREN